MILLFFWGCLKPEVGGRRSENYNLRLNFQLLQILFYNYDGFV